MDVLNFTDYKNSSYDQSMKFFHQEGMQSSFKSAGDLGRYSSYLK